MQIPNITIDACALLAHAKTPSQRTNHERVWVWIACEGCKIVKIPLVSKRKLVASPLDLATWPPGLWLIDLIYRACACMLPHNSPAWRNIVFVLAARPERQKDQTSFLLVPPRRTRFYAIMATI